MTLRWDLFTLAQSCDDEGEADEGCEHEIELVEAGEDSAEALESPEQAFDLVAAG